MLSLNNKKLKHPIMKTLAILKKLITFYFYITLLGFLFLLIGVPVMYYKEFALPITSMEDYNVSKS